MLDLIQAPVPSVALFQDFARDLIALKWSVMNSPDEPAETDAANTPLATQTKPNLVWNRVIAMLNHQTAEATRLGGPSSLEFHREAIYVMAALADETFLQLEWEGRDYWLNHLVEARLFRTHAAGEIFFRPVDGLLTREDDSAAELAAVYLFAIGLGFRGKFGGQGYSAELENYRAKLYAFVGRRKPALASSADTLFPEAYRNTIQGGVERRIPSTRKWRIALVCVFFAWLAIAQCLWWNLSKDLMAGFNKIDATLTDGSERVALPVRK
jgi:type VI secretion system protein ImpK